MMKEKPNSLKVRFMSSEKALNRIETMLESIQFIEELCEESGGVVKALDNRKLTRPAITMHLISIQEQIQKLQNEKEIQIIKSLTNYHLKGLADTRNVIAHDYEGLNLERMESTIRFDLPKLKDELKQILRKFKNQTTQEKLSRELKYYTEHKNSFYEDAKLKQEQTILKIYDELKSKGEQIDDKSLKAIETIQKAHSKSR